MRKRIALSLAVSSILAWPSLATANISCSQWKRLGHEQKAASVQGMIDGHLGSNAGKRFTNQNKAAMRRCLKELADRILEDIDDVCSDAKTAGMDAVDDVFDRYLVSCVQ